MLESFQDMRIILTRHGRTEENDAGILQGHLPGTLSKLGWSQARKVAERLRGENIDHIYSSDLLRSANTAREIGKYHPHIPIVFTEELRETGLGEFEGKTKKELGLDRPGIDIIAPKGGETEQSVTDRTEKFIRKIRLHHSHETVLVVGHGGINQKFVSLLTGRDLIEECKNTSISIFEIDENDRDNGAHIMLYNCIEHLK